ncbi:MAG: family 1 glycosylhydrolase, partial [Candidatus Limnocylindrales bacterium]
RSQRIARSSLAPTPAVELELDRGFVVASGIECSTPRIAGGQRQDELRKTGHWNQVEADLALVADFGIRFLRYGIPFHVVAHDPDRFDWTWTDQAMAELQARGIEPIADLLHFGLPDDLAGFIDPRLPARFLAFAAAFADRFPWVRYYTPVNEPLVSATFSARLGWWNECRTDDDSFARALDHVATCAAAAMEAIRLRRPDAIFIQSDACEGYLPTSMAAAPIAAFRNDLRFVTFDLVYGRRPAETVVTWLAEHGVGEDRLAWFEAHGSSGGCVVGHDYYAGNEWLVDADGTSRNAIERRGYAALAREYHAHLGLPFMLSETNTEGEAAPVWLAETWNEALQLRLEGLPIRGVCWYGFVDHVDWDSCLRTPAGLVNDCGLVDLNRRPHPVGDRYRELAMAALQGVIRPISIAPETGRVHHSANPAFALDGAIGPTVAAGEPRA